jgi:hypothetical protein
MMSLRLGSDTGRVLRAALAFAFILLFVLVFKMERANAETASGPTIFDVRRSLPLEPDEEVTKDFYINAGPESGLKKGVYVTVVRAVPVHDPIKNMQQATLNIPVGKLHVIDVQRGITVARLESELTDDDRPTLEFEGVMVGDHIDLGSISTDVPKKPKPKAKKHVASATPSADELAPGSAEAMAARAAAPTVLSATSSASVSAPTAAALTATAAAPTAAVANVQMTTNADVKPEAASAATAPTIAPNERAAAKPEEAPKKSTAPKSADMDLEHPEKKSFAPRTTTDTVRVADYTDVGY